MSTLTLTQSQQSTAALPGTWRLDAGRAVTLRPREDSLLRVAGGGIWLTFDGPHAGPLNDLGDRVLAAGQQVRVRAGQRLVLESNQRRAPAFFSWDLAPQVQEVRVPRRQAVAQSWRELHGALVLAGQAGWRLLAALAGLALGGARSRPQPDRCCAM
ncbi:DUF2917 domain-containing protein [Ramlibacter tataouinensis]|uniref:DUF2917 domain-containing protein n=1 Tax=Ramlibacter tataouinensis TaxID=94132 RepID=UPI0022F3ABAB|nr:DUF2917 domain-containing protein [Ramlibacter tataouinensis]WBY03610.1 DUF2917 domain-containing protein [Ramlibacter tataouinensis]